MESSFHQPSSSSGITVGTQIKVPAFDEATGEGRFSSCHLFGRAKHGYVVKITLVWKDADENTSEEVPNNASLKSAGSLLLVFDRKRQ